jgi:uncharacterized membrane protein
VLFIMLSNHYPVLYNHAWNWLLLLVLAVSGALVRHSMVTKKPVERWVLVPAALGLLALVWATALPGPRVAAGAGAAAVLDAAPRVGFAEVHTIIEKRCSSCHSSHPTDDIYTAPPNGVIFETEAQLRAKAPMVRLHVVAAKSMPLLNKTGMTEEERAVMARWLEQEGL